MRRIGKPRTNGKKYPQRPVVKEVRPAFLRIKGIESMSVGNLHKIAANLNEAQANSVVGYFRLVQRKTGKVPPWLEEVAQTSMALKMGREQEKKK